MSSKKINPFAVNYELQLLKIETTESIKKEAGSINWSYNVEKQKHTKVYHTPYDDKLFFSLSPKSLSLIFYIILNIKENEDFIPMSYQLVSQKINISLNTYYSCMKELKDNAFIANKERGIYWVNPQIIFNGNRMRYFEERYPASLVIVHTLQGK